MFSVDRDDFVCPRAHHDFVWHWKSVRASAINLRTDSLSISDKIWMRCVAARTVDSVQLSPLLGPIVSGSMPKTWTQMSYFHGNTRIWVWHRLIRSTSDIYLHLPSDLFCPIRTNPWVFDIVVRLVVVAEAILPIHAIDSCRFCGRESFLRNHQTTTQNN